MTEEEIVKEVIDDNDDDDDLDEDKEEEDLEIVNTCFEYIQSLIGCVFSKLGNKNTY